MAQEGCYLSYWRAGVAQGCTYFVLRDPSTCPSAPGVVAASINDPAPGAGWILSNGLCGRVDNWVDL